MMCRDQLSQATQHENFQRPFNEWIAKRFHIQTAHNWASIILFMNSGDQNGAFDMTKDLWEQYKAESQHRT
jgi:hypothetical protein